LLSLFAICAARTAHFGSTVCAVAFQPSPVCVTAMAMPIGFSHQDHLCDDHRFEFECGFLDFAHFGPSLLPE
jgi:hypothetical protein